MAKSKITKFDAKKPFQGVTSVFVAFEDETWGFYEFKGDAPFKEGDEVEYVATPEKTKTGKPITKLTISKVGSQEIVPKNTSIDAVVGIKQSNTSPDAIKMKFDSRMQLVKLTHDLLIQGKFTDKEAQEHCVAWVSLADGLINELLS